MIENYEALTKEKAEAITKPLEKYELLTIFLKNCEMSFSEGKIVMIKSNITDPDEINKIIKHCIKCKCSFLDY